MSQGGFGVPTVAWLHSETGHTLTDATDHKVLDLGNSTVVQIEDAAVRDCWLTTMLYNPI